ncbi:peptide ABC transporter substrate-binding protein [Gluconacetobacter azotocaptans]|uniref:peptide ABC transporter substrate-binding protein n=1 Tax=Gluconacetobacter azotocaptans TaxID=142834 RepID=UPI00195E66BB|nr:peptide ABC transporter substrate-binding protein [Gluconacetobacter azotocaptans]MBM9401076.1 peptide ABC transporter substrate-binding protein [Gluconacetobacter azotocaptans]
MRKERRGVAEAASEVPGQGYGRRTLLAAGGAAITALAVGGFSYRVRDRHLAPGQLALSDQCVDAFLHEAVNFNPLLYMEAGPETAVEYSVFDTLWRVDPSGQYVPNLAERIPTVGNGGISSDGLDWTIQLRRDVRWHDGKPFTARDVLFTLRVLMNPAIPVRSRNGQTNVEALSALDEHTVRIRLSRPFAAYMVALERTSIIPEHLLAMEPDLARAPFNSRPIGTGPFRFQERVAGDYIAFLPNLDYHGGKPAIGRLIQKYIPDQQTLFAQLQTGAVTVLDGKGIPADLYERSRTDGRFNVVLAPAPYVEFLYFNLGRPQFADKQVRHAIHYAVDRTAWVDQLYYGLPEATLSYLPSSHWAYNHMLKAPPFDLAKARQLLDAAGWLIQSDGVRAKGDVRLTFTCSTAAGEKSREEAQLLLQQNLRDIGMEMAIHNMPSAVVYGDYTTNSEFDMVLVGWDPMFYPDPDYSERVASHLIPAKTGRGANYSQFSHPEVDQLCSEGLATLDQEERLRIYWRIQEILLEELPFIPIFSYRSALGVSKQLKNFAPNPYTPCNSWNNAQWRMS